MNISNLSSFISNQYYKKNADKETVLTELGQQYLDGLKKEKRDKEIETENIKKEINDVYIANRISAITSKLKTGLELSNSELEFLKNNNPDLYRKAMQIKKERDFYRKALESCTTKEQVHTMHMMKVSSLANAQKKAEASGNADEVEQIGFRLAATENEYLKFTGSKKYNELPSETEIKTGKKQKKQKTTFTVYFKNCKDKNTVNLSENIVDKKA